MGHHRIPGVVRITINDEDHPDDPDKWTVEDVERLDEIKGDEPFVICRLLTLPLMEPDNKVGRCAGCGTPVQYRPDNAIPVKVCDLCSTEWMMAHAKAS